MPSYPSGAKATPMKTPKKTTVPVGFKLHSEARSASRVKFDREASAKRTEIEKQQQSAEELEAERLLEAIE